MQNHQTQRHSSVQTATAAVAINFTNTAKLPIETVKLLIASISVRPNLWNRSSNGQKRSDINALWHQVSQEVHLPADICRIKWGHLRDNFRKVFIRNTLSAEPPTTWRFYNDMRFMETAVAENVMRHHKFREQSFYWQKLHSTEQRQSSASSATVTALHDNNDRFVQNQFNFSELSAFFQNQGSSSINKRIKLETFESESSLHDHTQDTPPHSFYENGSAYDKVDPLLHIGNNAEDNLEFDDDDQCDENATLLEDNYEVSIKNDKLSFNKNTQINVQNRQLSKTEMNSENMGAKLDEDDSDRMFLLSLLPYLRKVKEHRKLQVRQRLQNVLIQEFS